MVSSRLLCRLFGHKRSGLRAYRDVEDSSWRSYCHRCGTPMKKDARGWQVEGTSDGDERKAV
jgi:hypothetical protein